MPVIRASRLSRFVWLALVAAGCSPSEPDAVGSGSANPVAARAFEPTLYGRWTIAAIDGSPPLRFETADAPDPSLAFSPSRYGGSTGCNSFGGTGLLVGNRWFGEPPIATQQGCGELAAQEDAIIGIAAGGPVVSFQGKSGATLTTGTGSLRLNREAEDPPFSKSTPMLLAGTAWEVRTIDGRQPGAPNGGRPAVLTFEADRWTLGGLCAPLSGSWRQSGRTVTMAATSQPPRNCGPAEKSPDEALRAMIAAGPRYVVGPNRELVMGAGAHWLTGQFASSSGGDDKALIRGEWRIDTVDGAAPAASERRASLAFGNASYAIWDGCNHTEGILLTFARQLFTRGSGMSTLARCMPDPIRPHIRRIVADNPRIAKTGDGGIALVSPAGTLRLTRLSGRPFGVGEQLGLRAPITMTLLKPQATLTLAGANRFAIDLGCGRIEGSWRGGQPARFSPDPIERSAPACGSDPDALRLSQFFSGNVLAVIGPNRDIVLLVNEDESIAGRLSR